jgi:hypothetical protein
VAYGRQVQASGWVSAVDGHRYTRSVWCTILAILDYLGYLCAILITHVLLELDVTSCEKEAWQWAMSYVMSRYCIWNGCHDATTSYTTTIRWLPLTGPQVTPPLYAGYHSQGCFKSTSTFLIAFIASSSSV